MIHSETEPTTSARGTHPAWLYATSADFSVVFENDFEPLYRLAFLLTANHDDAERCFAAAIEDVFENSAVLKDWARSWIKRSIIKNAIRMVFSESAPRTEELDFRFDWKTSGAGPAISPVTLLPPFERFVFVMVILEGYSDRECSVLLNCAVERVGRARIQALQWLPSLNLPLTRDDVSHRELAMGVRRDLIAGTG